MANVIDRSIARAEAGLVSARQRWPRFDHVWRAGVRYDDVYGGRLAAASAYFGFFAVFALSMLGFVLLGQIFRNNRTVIDTVSLYLRANLPQLNTKEVLESSQQVGIIAVIGLVIAGVGWVETLRSSQRALWQLEQQPGHPVIRWLVDLAVLLGLGVLLMLSIAVSAGLQDFVLRVIGQPELSPLRVTLRGWNSLIAGAVDLILGAALLAGVPRLRMSLRRLLPSALLFAVGLGILKTLGKWYITRTENNPAYQLVAGTVGVLIFMYLLHQLLLFAAAVAATSTRGRVVDLARGRVMPDVVAVSAERAAVSVERAAKATERAAESAKEIVSTGAAASGDVAAEARGSGGDVAAEARGSGGDVDAEAPRPGDPGLPAGQHCAK
jgi:membrane protein